MNVISATSRPVAWLGTFTSLDALEEPIAWRMREVSDVHRHSTTNERPIDLFEREEVAALRTLPQLPPFHTER